MVAAKTKTEPMPLGNMRSLAKGIAPDRAKRAEVGRHSERKFLINKKFLTAPASNLHIPNDSVALCLKQTFCDGYHYFLALNRYRRAMRYAARNRTKLRLQHLL
jgi:hypothetical protein